MNAALKTSIALLVAGVVSPAIAQVEGNLPNIEIIRWVVTRVASDFTAQTFTVYDRDAGIGTPADIFDFLHFERDRVSVRVDVSDPDWIQPITQDPLTGEFENNNEEVFLRIQAFGLLGFAPPEPPPIGVSPEGFFPEEDGFIPLPGPSLPHHFFFTFNEFVIPEFIGRNQRRLRGEIDFDVGYNLSLCVTNDKDDEDLYVCLGQPFFVIENPALRPGNPQSIADAGADRTVAINSTIIIDASRTFDAFNEGFDVNDPNVFEKDLLIFAWELLSGPAPVTIVQDNANDPTGEIILPIPGEYVFRVIVDDNASSSPPSADQVIITALETLPPQTPPVALAAHPAGPVQVGALITLDGRQSFDPDGDPITFRWRQTNALGDAIELEDLEAAFQPLSGVDGSVSTWRAVAPGTYYFRLLVSDGVFQVATDLFSVEVVQTLTGGRTETNGTVVTGTSGDGEDSAVGAVAPLCGAGLLPLAAAPFAMLLMRRRTR